MIKTFVFFLLLTVVYCANVRRQVDNDDENSLVNYSNSEDDEGSNDREEWQRRIEIERLNQRQRPTEELPRPRYMIKWVNANYGDEKQRYEWERNQLLRQRAEQDYGQYYEPGSSVPYWIPYNTPYNWGRYAYV
ncbi:uncharacterized protein LOC112050208 [Bicyclus anynana]|uniref:Uncharacterized protein LOC112050208 n=1 Tax=Bicyclus anynana TaxID=110368 RepID=A0A6J1NGT2_BICAN|nr:uncharacterized protein LOC112050208 [Bicyclus anynana]